MCVPVSGWPDQSTLDSKARPLLAVTWHIGKAYLFYCLLKLTRGNGTSIIERTLDYWLKVCSEVFYIQAVSSFFSTLKLPISYVQFIFAHSAGSKVRHDIGTYREEESCHFIESQLSFVCSRLFLLLYPFSSALLCIHTSYNFYCLRASLPLLSGVTGL